MENWHLVKSQKKSGDYESHVVKVLFASSICSQTGASVFKLLPFVLLCLLSCNIKTIVAHVYIVADADGSLSSTSISPLC